ncbi:hypothetical protein HTVC100P_gp57 [Pelagibacter phage HTVC100P]|nr:hypothetical protein HTVC100P_gp57 [Pelagibacter phage HTVC100P]
MGSNSASTGGGGGGVGPAGLVTKTGKTGTAKDAKKVQRRNELRTFIKEGGVTGALLKGITGKTAYEMNLERRQKFIKSKGLTGDDINMDPSYLGSKKGLAELRKQGYTTVSDTVNTGGGNDNQVVQAPLEATTMPVETPSSIEVTEPVMTAEEARAKASDLIKKKRRGKGRDTLIATSPQGVTNEGLTLSNKSLLG